ncbi:unnamed protein product [Rodentolepis nana]|uniref:E3 ubiquitin-protein ligase n=1 Tax=Rodentolepis nana TaxID=102285 RepID=A0A0R3TYH0_RODNA|nr:unnamed protein product [Rodentolepis nana]
MIINIVSSWSDREFFSSSNVDLEELHNFGIMRRAIDTIHQNDMDALKVVLTQCPFNDYRDYRGQTILQWAASYGTAEMVEFIYSNLPDDHKYDPEALLLTVLRHRMDNCRTLLQHREVVSDGDVSSILLRSGNLSVAERNEVEVLRRAAQGGSRTPTGEDPQAPAMENLQTEVEFDQDDSQVPKTKSVSMMVYIFVTEIIPVLITAHNRSSNPTIRRIAIYQVRRLIGLLPVHHLEFINELTFHGRDLCHWLCGLINTSFCHDVGLACEESVLLYNQLLFMDSRFYYDLSKLYNFKTSLEYLRNQQLFGILQHLGLFEGERNEANSIISSLQSTYHVQFCDWSVFRLGEVLLIYNDVAICVLKYDGINGISNACVYTTEIGDEIVTCSSPVRRSEINSIAHQLIYLVEFVRKINNPRLESDVRRHHKETTPANSSNKSSHPLPSTSKAFHPNTIHLCRIRETMVSMEPFEMEFFQAENEEYFLRVKVGNENFFLFSESPSYTIYHVREYPMQIKMEEGTPVVKQFQINERIYRVDYESGSLTESLPFTQTLSSPRWLIRQEAEVPSKLSIIANEISSLLSIKNEGYELESLKKSFCRLKKQLLKDPITITTNVVITSGIVRVLLQCLSISPSTTKSDVNDELTQMDRLDALMKRREVFLSVFDHEIAFYKLIQCIKAAFEEIEHLPLYLFNHLQSCRAITEDSLGIDDKEVTHVSYQKVGSEGGIEFDILRLLSHFLYTQRSNSNLELHNPLFTWNADLCMEDSSMPIKLNFRNPFSLNQVQRNRNFNFLLHWSETSENIGSYMLYLGSYPFKRINLAVPYIQWLSSSGETRSNWIDAVYRGYIRAYSFLPNSQGVYHSGVDIPLLRSPFSEQCIVCKNKAITNSHFPDIDFDICFMNLQVGARYVIDLRADLVLHCYCLTTLRNVDKNEDIVNWCLQASNDGKSWITLKVHKNDRTLNSEEPVIFEIEHRLSFRIYRIMDLSPINQQGRLHVCGLDFYGTIVRFHRKPLELNVLAQVPESIRYDTPSEVPTVAEFYMTNLMKSIRDGEFHVHPSGFSGSVYNLATGWSAESSHERVGYSHMQLLISPLTKDYLRIAQKMQSQWPVWRLQFELVVKQQNGDDIASYPIFDLRQPLFTYLVSLVEQLVLKRISINTLRDAKLIIRMKSASPTEKEDLKQEWTSKRGGLLSDGDWNVVTRRNEFCHSIPGKATKKCVNKEAAEDMLKLIQLLHQLFRSRVESMKTDGRNDFISEHITRKIKRQLNDNVAVMTGPTFPNWCFNLLQKMNFLFTFEFRLEIFRACALGPARSMKWIQDNGQKQDPKYANDHFYSYLPYSINPMFEDLESLSFRQTFKEIYFWNQEAVDGTIVTDCTKIIRNLTEGDNAGVFLKWAERVLEENADRMTNLTIGFNG